MKRLFLLTSVLSLLLVSLVFTGICLANEPYKIAVVLSGPINDGGWNSTAYESLIKMQKMVDFEFSYSENVSKSEQEEVFRGYAADGYDLVIGHGFQFGDTALKIGPQFKDTFFLVTSSDQHIQEPNVGCGQLSYSEDGFILGCIAALLTETNKLGYIYGLEMPPHLLTLKYFKLGASYYNPDVEIYTACLGGYDDLNKAKEAGLAMIEKGVDVLLGNANQASAGVALGAQQKGIFYIGTNNDQHAYAPGTVVTSNIRHWDVLFEDIVRSGISGEFKAKYYEVGWGKGSATLAPFREFEDRISAEKKEKIFDLIEKIKSGEIKVKDFDK